MNHTACFLAIIFFLPVSLVTANDFNGDPGCTAMTNVFPLAIREGCNPKKEWCDCISPKEWYNVEKIQDVQLKIAGEINFSAHPEGARNGVQELRERENLTETDLWGALVKIGRIEDAQVGGGGYFRLEWHPEPAFLLFLDTVLWGFAGDPEKKWVYEHKEGLVFYEGICRVRLEGFADIVTDPDAKMQNMEQHFNEYHWADYRKVLIYNKHIGFDHGAARLKEKLFETAREIDGNLKKTGVCDGYLAGAPKILDVQSIPVPEDSSASEYVAFRLKFQNVGRLHENFDLWIDHCDNFAGKDADIVRSIRPGSAMSDVQTGEIKTVDVIVHILASAPPSGTCRVRLKSSFRSSGLDKRIELEDAREVTLLRGASNTEPKPAVQEPRNFGSGVNRNIPQARSGEREGIPLSLGSVAMGTWVLRKFWKLFLLGSMMGFGTWLYRRNHK